MNEIPRPGLQRAPVVLCTFDDAYAARFTRALEHCCPVIHISPLQQSATTTIESMKASIAVFDLHTVKTENQTIFDLMRQLGSRFPAIRKIALGHRSIPDQVIAAMKSGACDFLDRDADPLEIEETILDQASHSVMGEHSRIGHVIAVVGAKPTEHESFLSANLAAHLATLHPDRSILLLDLDLERTELQIDFDVEITYSLHDAIQEHVRLEKAMLERVLTRHKTGLYLLPLTLKRSSNEEVSPQALAGVLGSLRTIFDIVVVDAGCLRHDLCRSYLFSLCDRVLVLVSQQIGSIRAAQELFGEGGPKVELIVTDYDTDIDLPTSKIGQRVGASIIATLPPSASDLANSHNSGIPLAIQKPKSPYVKAVMRLAQQLVPGTAHTPNNGLAKVATKLTSLLLTPGG